MICSAPGMGPPTSGSQLALRKLPEIDQLILRATTVQQLLRFCGDCRCSSIDECRLLEERTKLLDHRSLGLRSAADNR